jgi:lipopolysaccharide biosynthesis glycosyltransferase
MEINIAVSFDKHYQKYATVCLNSILLNSTSTNKIKIFIITDLKEKQFIWQLKKVLKHFNYSINDLGSDFDKLPTGFHFTKAMYGLLAIPRILAAKGIKKALYLDLDMLILNDLQELFSQDIGEYYCAGAHDIHSQNPDLNNRLGLQQGFVINSGVLLMNIFQMNKVDWVKESENLNREGKISWGDQDIVNILMDGKIKLLDQKWNVQSGNVQNSYNEDINIIHFTESNNSKPWKLNSSHRYLNVYNTYIRKSGFLWDYLWLESFRRLRKIKIFR